MRRRLSLDPLADRDLDEIFDYIANRNPSAARRFYAATFVTFQALVERPGLGRLRQFTAPELHGVRSSAIKGFPNYLAFYAPTASGIRIMRVIHGARDIEELLGAERDAED